MNPYQSILITGGNGMLAHALIRALKLRGHQPIAPARQELDITDAASLRTLFSNHKPTLLLNCAAHTKVDLCEQQPQLADEINGDALATLAVLSKEFATKLVHYSTDFVFDGSSPRPYLPVDPTNPLSAYGRSKLLGEHKLRQVNPAGHLLIRTSWVYGPHGASFPQTMINAARAGKLLRVVSDQTGTPTYTRDLADATLNLIDSGAVGLFHVTNSGQTTWFDFTRAILEEFSLTADLQPITSSDWLKLRPQSAIRPAYSVLDTSEYTRVTGKPLRPWREALRDYRIAVAE